MLELVDTHCHIHFADYGIDPDKSILAANEAGITQLICVGTDVPESERAVEFVQTRLGCWAAVGLHPHEATRYAGDEQALRIIERLAGQPKVVAIGEVGLDYHYNYSPKREQRQLLHQQLALAQDRNLPLIFHVREAFDDFWTIIDEYEGLRGVVHSFTAHEEEMVQVLQHNFFVGFNGIMTFTKDPAQLAAVRTVPLEKLLLETDAPFLTPVPFRGKICQPEHLRVTAEFIAELRQESLSEVAAASTRNAQQLFKI